MARISHGDGSRAIVMLLTAPTGKGVARMGTTKEATRKKTFPRMMMIADRSLKWNKVVNVARLKK
jgi:hypothetical protein